MKAASQRIHEQRFVHLFIFRVFLSEHVLLLRSQNINMKDIKVRNEHKRIIEVEKLLCFCR